jgi:hypothetical protein
MPKLLGSIDVARFVQQGFLRFDELVATRECAALLDEVRSGEHWQNARYGQPLSTVWSEESALRRIFARDPVRGIIESLLGPEPIYDHHFPHTSHAGSIRRDDLHQDAMFDRRPFAFDIQLCLFPQNTTLEMGGTLIVPGSHFRRVHTGDINRYQHIKGQQQIACKAGTLLVLHHNLWHSGRSNRSSSERVMFKLRLQPSRQQYLTWDWTDLDHPEVSRVVSTEHAWHGADARMGVLQQLALWRYLCGELPARDVPHYGQYLDRE